MELERRGLDFIALANGSPSHSPTLLCAEPQKQHGEPDAPRGVSGKNDSSCLHAWRSFRDTVFFTQITMEAARG